MRLVSQTEEMRRHLQQLPMIPGLWAPADSTAGALIERHGMSVRIQRSLECELIGDLFVAMMNTTGLVCDTAMTESSSKSVVDRF